MINIKSTANLVLFFLLLGFLPLTAWADGFIIIPPPDPRPRPLPIVPPPPVGPFPLEVTYHHVAVTIKDTIATTQIDQAFYNPTRHRLEGYYLFPIPSGAALQDFSMTINGKRVYAEMLDAEKARSLYENIVRQLRDPALLEYSNQGIFKMKIFPIEPGETKKIFISYHEVLDGDGGLFQYRYPLNTEKFSSKPLQDVDITVNLETSQPLKTLYSPTHDIRIKRQAEGRATISYSEHQVRPDRDFILYFHTDKSALGLTLLTQKKSYEDGFFFLSITPSFSNTSPVSEKDIVFVLDVSGSMAGEKLKHAQNALLYCLHNLNKGDRFEIIRFSTEAYSLFQGLKPLTEANRQESFDFVNNLKPVGGTNIEQALEMALRVDRQKSRPCFIIFITDGKPTIGETDENALITQIQRNNISNSRIFTFGIGHDLNTHLLDRITETTHASRTYITPDEDIELKISSFFDKVQSPILTDIRLTFSSPIRVHQLYPQRLPDIFHGSSMMLFGRYHGDGKCSIELEGYFNQQKKTETYSVYFPKQENGNEFLPALWATRRVGFLLDEIRLHGEDKELVDEVTSLARLYGIITPYTSYLIMEDESVRIARRALPEELSTIAGSPLLGEADKKRYKKEYESMNERSGKAGVQISQEFQQLADATSTHDQFRMVDRMDLKDSNSGQTISLNDRLKQVQGRAFYLVNKTWVDSRLQMQKSPAPKRIHFGSDEYFALLEKSPELAQILAIGSQLRFYHDNKYYEIYE